MIYIIQTISQARFAYNALSRERILGADVETTGLNPFTEQVLLVQLGTPKDAYIFDIGKLPEKAYKFFGDILESKLILKIFQNGKFDYKMLKSNFGMQTNHMADTMIAEQLLTKGIKKSGFGLEALAAKYKVGKKLNKSIRKGFIGKKLGDSFTKQEINYAADDVFVVHKIYAAQLKIAEKLNMTDLIDLENRTVKAIAEMEYNGIFIDKTKWLALEDIAKKEKKIAEGKLNKFFTKGSFQLDIFGGLGINYNSPLQLKPLLEGVMGSELESTNEKYLSQFKHSVLDALFDYREHEKKITTYGSKFLEEVFPLTGRIHADYKQLGADSGRMACRNPNIQNIPAPGDETPDDKNYRVPFCVQNKDYRFISADFSAQELAILTQMSKEKAFLDAILNNRDLHKMSAALVFDVPEAEVTKKQRKFAKTVTFSLVYGTSAYGLGKSLKIPTREAEDLMNKYFRVFPSIKNLLDSFVSTTERERCAISPLDGRRRDLANVDWEDFGKKKHALNIAKNHPIQGTAASTTKLALVMLQDYIETYKKDAMIIAVIHDEILVECHKDIAEEMQKATSKSMITAFKYYCPDVPMKADAMIGTHWLH